MLQRDNIKICLPQCDKIEICVQQLAKLEIIPTLLHSMPLLQCDNLQIRLLPTYFNIAVADVFEDCHPVAEVIEDCHTLADIPQDYHGAAEVFEDCHAVTVADVFLSLSRAVALSRCGGCI